MNEDSPHEVAGEGMLEKGSGPRPESSTSFEPPGAQPAPGDDGSSKAFNDVLYSEVSTATAKIESTVNLKIDWSINAAESSQAEYCISSGSAHS